MAVDNEYYLEFDKKFIGYKKKKIAVYGTGLNARLIAENICDYNIVGYITTDKNVDFIKKNILISIEEAIERAEVIIIAATLSSTKIIYERIRDVVPNYILILNLYGEVINSDEIRINNEYWNKTFNVLCKEIDKHEIISFDIFDTVLTRNVLLPEDIFEELEDYFIDRLDIDGFKEYRKNAEIECNERCVAPNIDEIYVQLNTRLHLQKRLVAAIKDKEYQIERMMIRPRKVIGNAYKYAIQQGKQVIFTSDMYYNSECIERLLFQCGIEGDYSLLISCEKGASKRNGGLYSIVRNISSDDTVLHIGDNLELDGIQAEKAGLGTFTIKSGYDLLCESAFVSIIDKIRNKTDRKYLGFFVAECLNNPFALSETKGKLKVNNEADIALICYPITMMFLNYIIEQSSNYDCIVFPSRDGYFLFQLYESIRITRADLELPDAIYLYASRMSLSRAAIHDIESFDTLLEKLYRDQSQNCKEYFKNQFMFELSEEYDMTSGELIKIYGEDGLREKLHTYFGAVVEGLSDHSKLYRNYIQNNGLDSYSKIAMVDIVSYGTQIYCLSELLNRKVDMIALGTTSVPNKYIRNLDAVHCIYGNVNKETDGSIYSCSNLSVLHLLLEMLFASDKGQFIGFSNKGKPIYEKNTEYNQFLLHDFQERIKNISDELKKIEFTNIDFSSEFALGMMQLLFSKYSVLDQGLKERFAFSDPYMGGYATTNIADML